MKEKKYLLINLYWLYYCISQYVLLIPGYLKLGTFFTTLSFLLAILNFLPSIHIIWNYNMTRFSNSRKIFSHLAFISKKRVLAESNNTEMWNKYGEYDKKINKYRNIWLKITRSLILSFFYLFFFVFFQSYILLIHIENLLDTAFISTFFSSLQLGLILLIFYLLETIFDIAYSTIDKYGDPNI